MPKPTVPDLTGTGLSQARYLTLWDTYAQAALRGCLSFHGVDSHDGVAEGAAQLADLMMEARIARLLQAREDAAKEEDQP